MIEKEVISLTILKEYDDGKKHIHVLSYGAGTQSTALLLMALNGEINGVVPDYIIFADTGWEPKGIYDWVEKVNNHIKAKYGKEIIVTQNRNIRNDVVTGDTGRKNNFLTIPAFVKKEDSKSIGMGKRQCTQDYKITPIKKEIRKQLGYKPRQRVKEIVHIWKGISNDEISRVKPAKDKWQVAEHPLIEIMDVDRKQCIEYVENTGLGTPAKSSCIGCPYHDNRAWQEMKLNDPVSWNDAVEVDEALRANGTYDLIKGVNYLHRSGKPLKDVVFDIEENEIDMFDNECEGICGL